MQKFIDDVIDHKEDDIEKIQTKPNMYISYLGQKGSLHLAKEIINNAIDECINVNSPGDEINIYLDEIENTLMVSDNGRGFVFDAIELACTKLQAGSKFTREKSGSSAGENGVGMTAVNALSEFFEIVVTRYGQKGKIRFEGGKIKEPLKIKEIDNKEKHGTIVTFKPNLFFMGEDCAIPADKLMEWLDKIVYLIPSNLKINLNINRVGKETAIQKKYRNKNGLYDYVKKLCKKPLLEPIHFMKSMRLPEIIPVVDIDPETGKQRGYNKEVERFIGLEVAFTYNSSNTEMFADSFCNFVNTIDNGVHVDAVRTGLSQYITKQVKDNLSEREAKNLDILYSDVTQGLVLIVFLSTDMNPQFSGQSKEKMTSNEFFKPLREMTYRGLNEYFKKNGKDLKKIVDFVKMNAKARVEASKVRNAVVKGETTSLDEHKMKNFVPANNRGKHEYRELFLIEGDSAMGSARLGRFDNDTQALFALRGVPLNAFGLKLDKVLNNDEFRNLVKVLGCNIGERFDIEKLKYKKIIIMTDADIDGHRITSLLCAFFLVHLPEIVRQGYLYKAVSPLYRINDKKRPFVLNKQEFIERFEEKIRNNIKVIDPETNVVFNNKKLQEFLLINRNYLEELHLVANHFAIHPFIIEFLAIHEDEPDFLKKLKKKFPELTIDEDNVLSGIYEGRYQILIMDKIYKKRVKTLKDYIHQINKGKVYYKIHEVYGNNIEDKGLMSLGEFLTLCQKFQPEIEMRYKGLGELQPSQLRETTLDPNNRIFIQLTIEDLEKELEKFRILHGDDSDERKKLMEHFKISREELDN